MKKYLLLFAIAMTALADDDGPLFRIDINLDTLKLVPNRGWMRSGTQIMVDTAAPHNSKMTQGAAVDVTWSIIYGSNNMDPLLTVNGTHANDDDIYWYAWWRGRAFNAPLPSNKTIIQAISPYHTRFATINAIGKSYWNVTKLYRKKCPSGQIERGDGFCIAMNAPTQSSYQSFCSARPTATAVNAYVEANGTILTGPTITSQPVVLDCQFANNTGSGSGSGSTGGGGYPGPTGGPGAGGCDLDDPSCQCEDYVTGQQVNCRYNSTARVGTAVVNGEVVEAPALPIGAIDNQYQDGWGQNDYTITGWCYSAVTCAGVTIYRDPLPAEGDPLVYVGEASIFGGQVGLQIPVLRTDIQALLPAGSVGNQTFEYPYVAAQLPNGYQGNLYAIGQDIYGNSSLIASAAYWHGTQGSNQIQNGLANIEYSHANNAQANITIPAHDVNGSAHVTRIDGLVNTSGSGAQACFWEARITSGQNSVTPTGTLYLMNDAGTAWLPTTIAIPGSGFVSNTHCNITRALLVAFNHDISLGVNVNFPSTNVGNQFIYSYISDDLGQASPTLNVGSINLPGATGVFTDLSNVQVSAVMPMASQTDNVNVAENVFTMQISDTHGGATVNQAALLINNTISGAHACYVTLSPNIAAGDGSATVHLFSDDGTTYTTLLIPSTGTASNSQCTVYGANTNFFYDDNLFTANFDVKLKGYPYFYGNYGAYKYFSDTAGSSFGWTPYASFLIP